MRWTLLFALALAACGGPTPAPQAEEVTATWTAGDDAALPDDAPSERMEDDDAQD